MTRWPHSIPEDLRHRLASAMTARSYGPPELWGEIREWLIKHGVEPPENLPEYQPPVR